MKPIETVTWVSLICLCILRIFGNEIKSTESSIENISTEDTQLKRSVTLAASIESPTTSAVRNVVRLRNGTSYSGLVQVLVNGQLREVCSNEWNFKDANVLCKQMGFSRGAKALNSTFEPDESFVFRTEPVSRLQCGGNEKSILDCFYKLFRCSNGIPATVTCIQNRFAYCNEGEVQLDDNCYRFVPEVKTQAQALIACSSIGSNLLFVETAREFEFLSERLPYRSNYTKWHTSGHFYKFEGWKWLSNLSLPFSLIDHSPQDNIPALLIRDKEICMALHFLHNSSVELDEFYWVFSSCYQRLPFICKHPRKNIGCIEKGGEEYTGEVNVTRSGIACLPWDTPNLPIFVSKEIFNQTLRGHNYCRNPDADDAPWCYYSLSKYDFCDIPTCKNDTRGELSFGTPVVTDASATVCPKTQYRCKFGMCIQQYWVCDGDEDCIGGDDEEDCPNHLSQFVKYVNQTIVAEHLHVFKPVALQMCARHCMEQKNQSCKAFVYNPSLSRCLISDRNRTSGVILWSRPRHDYYERIIKTDTPCENDFRCANEKCIPMSSRCNRVDDCGDGSDEINCITPTSFAIRLVNGSSPHEGRVEVRYIGIWGIVCDDQWDLVDAHVVCRQLNYHRGASRSYRYSRFGNGNGKYIMSNVDCNGNETSLDNCGFAGWGHHSCGMGEAAGVTCFAPEKCIEGNEFTCQSGQCILLVNACDGDADCSDGSDELPENCNDALEVRLVNGTNELSGRVEIKHNGVWGTICDDTWDSADAQVVCNTLGFFGTAEPHLNGPSFGPGTGPIWLDELHCFGLERHLLECDKGEWLRHDCTHTEDVMVTCTIGEEITTTAMPVAAVLPRDCGTRIHNDIVNASGHYVYGHERIAGGMAASIAAYPWHVSVRIKQGYGTSRSWCGGSIISEFFIITAAHCLEDHGIQSYLIRVGDSNAILHENEENEYEVVKVIKHPYFRQGQRTNNDIALMKIKPKNGTRGFEFGDNVRPICLPSPATLYTPNIRCYITGYGDTAGRGSVSRLQIAMVPILPRSTCSRSVVYGPSRLTAGMFCAGYLEGGIDTCSGDSGGPLACPMEDGRFALYGVTSWGHGCAKPNKPGVYVTVAHYLGWIYRHLNESTPNPNYYESTSTMTLTSN